MLLFCLPFAGGSSFSYRGLYGHLESFVTPRFLEIPGHGSRASEPLLRDITAMVDDCFDTVRRLGPDRPYALYGHSMGAVIGFLLTRRIVVHGLPPPEHLFFSGRQGPAVADKAPGRHLLPRPQFLSMLEEFEGSPKEVLANRELMEYFEPILRADFQACESYRYESLPPLPVPITVMYGQQEKNSREEFLTWQKETSCELDHYSFPGGHFFIFDHFAEIGRIVSATLRAVSLA
jgi:surfactin synthase thioesterase subunit